MARTANRYLKEISKEKEIKIMYRAGSYLRLSVDSDFTGSDSLENQRRLTQEYADKCSDIMMVKEYVDNGKTGTNFSRPAFFCMMEDLKQGVINCVIVKDLSRFGREYIEAGNYIEKVFPFLGVRFISVVDRYDSMDTDRDRELLLLALKNLMHEMYAKDISKKIGAAFQVRWENKLFRRASTIPYGYQMDEENKNYCVDEKAAAIVREIYVQYSKGISKYSISRWLYKHRVVNPQQYQETGSIFALEGDELKSWSTKTIQRILKSQVYIGNIVMHQTEQNFSEGKKASVVPAEKQIFIEDNHPPIISKEMFLDVQKRCQQSQEDAKEKRKNSSLMKTDILFDENIIKGKLFCGDCRETMLRTNEVRYVHKEKERYKIFCCRRHFRYKEECDSRKIKEKELYGILAITIGQQIALIKKYKTQMEESLIWLFKEKMQRIEREKQKIQNKKVLLSQEYMQNYLEYKEGGITENQFQDFRKVYGERSERLDKQLNEYHAEEKQGKKLLTEVRKMIKRWMQFDGFNGMEEFTREIIDTCVERIDVFANNRIHICLNYRDCFQQLDEWVKRGSEMI